MTDRNVDDLRTRSLTSMFNLRTRLFVAWGVLTLLVWGCILVVTQGTVLSSFDRSARHSFDRTKLSLESLQSEQSRRMRQAAVLVMQIPELRALIAEYSYELQSHHAGSLEERLDNLADVVDVSFICAFDANATLIGRSRETPWTDAEAFDSFARGFDPARLLIRKVYRATDGPILSRGADGLWTYQGNLYKVVVVPLIFQADGGGEHGPIEGALMIGSPWTDELAEGLGQSHDCEVSFLTAGKVAASSIEPAFRPALLEIVSAESIASSRAFESELARTTYLTFPEPLRDPGSGQVVGAIVIQRDLDESQTLVGALMNRMLFIVGCGLLLACIGSFLVSTAITRPIRQMVSAFQRVSEGDLRQSLPENDRSEIGALAVAFNDMVRQLRQRRRLERRVVEVETAARTRSEFLANMSHEIRTPMTAILGYADLLRDPALSPDRRMEWLRVIRRNGDHLLSIINDILDLSKIEAGEMTVERIECQPCAILADVASLMRVRASDRSLDLSVVVEGRIPQLIRTDPTRLRQILLNLVGNAIKFTDSGTVRVTADMPVQQEGAPPRLRFRVIDSGIGMTPEQIERVFAPFTQADETTARRFGGTGLGLAICRRLTEMLGGSISVESALDRGSTFSFTIETGSLDGVPMIARFDPTVIDDETGDDSASVGRLQGRVLLADDSADIRRLLSHYLRAAGTDVTEAENGRIAYEEAMRPGSRFDLVLMDMQMPELDGFTAVERLRDDGCRIPIVALTANAMADDEARCRACGCTDYLTKPIARSDLLRAVALYVGRSDEATRGAVADRDQIRSITESYIAALPEKVSRVRALLDEGKLTELASLLHTLRGTAGMFNLMSITDHAAAAETAIRDDAALAMIAGLVEALIEEIRRADGVAAPNDSAGDTRPRRESETA